jgi:EmrB/QacA subfamily drug resistance transporter
VSVDADPAGNAGAAPAGVDERAAWIAMTVVMGGTIMVVLDTTIVNVALHQIGIDLDAGRGIEWVVTAYLLAVCVSQPATGWLAERFGRKQVFLGSLVAFTAASLACAAAPNLPFLIGARIVQGLGGGALMPVGMAIGLGLFPKERHGRAVAVWGMAAMIGPAIGPTLGGWLSTSVSWHWLFLVNAPIGAVTLVAGLRILRDDGRRTRAPFDRFGLLTGCGGLSLAVLALSQGNTWGWGSPSTVAGLVLGAAGLVAFVGHELRVEHPLIELRMFQDRSFRLAMGASCFLYIAQFGRLVFLPLELEGLRGESALRVGLLFLPAAICTAIAMSIGGRSVDRMGPRLPIMTGASLVLVSMVVFATMSLTTPIAVVAVAMCIQGSGIGLITAPATVAGLSELPDHLVAQGTAVRSLLGQVSGALSVAVLGLVVATATPADPTPRQAQAGFNAAFVAAAVGVTVAVYIASRLPRGKREAAPDLSEALVAAEL